VAFVEHLFKKQSTSLLHICVYLEKDVVSWRIYLGLSPLSSSSRMGTHQQIRSLFIVDSDIHSEEHASNDCSRLRRIIVSI
jgi:hypothetical protein